MQLVMQNEILRTSIYRIPHRTQSLICGEYMNLKLLFEGSGLTDVIVKMEEYQLDDSFSRLSYRVFGISEYPEQPKESLGKSNILNKTSSYP
jgi:hypothetical protein